MIAVIYWILWNARQTIWRNMFEYHYPIGIATHLERGMVKLLTPCRTQLSARPFHVVLFCLV